MDQSEVPDDDVYDLLVIGGGVVGLSVLREATLAGYRCSLVEHEPHLLQWASGSNSGIVCTGVDASGLERALIRDSISRIRPFLRDMNIPVRPCGSLICQWPWDNTGDETVPLHDTLQESLDAGDDHAKLLWPAEVLAMEPNLNRQCLSALHIPGEIVVDPWLFSIAHAVLAVENGATIITDFRADMESSVFENGIWMICSKATETAKSSPQLIRAQAVVNATGIWADQVQLPVTEPTWTAKPRRGQYIVLQPTESSTITHPIQPVPTQRTKGVFVFFTIYNQLVVGPTALDQESRTDRIIDPEITQELGRIGKRVISELDWEAQLIGEYVGIRPGTDKRDYVIQANVAKHWIVCAGIRSTGLTASLGIGRHVMHLLHQGILPECEPLASIKKTPLPPVDELIRDFQRRSDGCVCIHGAVYKVTHPLTIYGWTHIALGD